jgi:hypothetical protein
VTAISNIQNWHRYVLTALGIIGALMTAIIAQPAVVPLPLHDLVSWAPFILLIDGSIVAFIPRIQTSTGPGAAPILSPPAPPPKG